MNHADQFSANRLALRREKLEVISKAASRHGAIALHIFGSIGRGTADALSDIDAWLTFPDATIGQVVRDRRSVYREAGEILIAHEMTANRPRGGAYALVLYASPVGPIQIDWYLAPKASSFVDSSARTIFASEVMPVGDLPFDGEAHHNTSQSERIDWLICMLFVAIKAVARGGSQDFVHSLGEAYQDVFESYGLNGCGITKPHSFSSIATMLRQIEPHAREEQRRAIHAIDGFQRELQNHLTSNSGRI